MNQTKSLFLCLTVLFFSGCSVVFVFVGWFMKLFMKIFVVAVEDFFLTFLMFNYVKVGVSFKQQMYEHINVCKIIIIIIIIMIIVFKVFNRTIFEENLNTFFFFW